MPTRKDTNKTTDQEAAVKVDDEVRKIKMGEGEVPVIDDRQAQIEKILADEQEPERVNVEVPVPGNIDEEAFKRALDLQGRDDAELTLEEAHQKHHPEWYSNADVKSTDETQATAEPEKDETKDDVKV